MTGVIPGQNMLASALDVIQETPWWAAWSVEYRLTEWVWDEDSVVVKNYTMNHGEVIVELVKLLNAWLHIFS